MPFARLAAVAALETRAPSSKRGTHCDDCGGVNPLFTRRCGLCGSRVPTESEINREARILKRIGGRR